VNTISYQTAGEIIVKFTTLLRLGTKMNWLEFEVSSKVKVTVIPHTVKQALRNIFSPVSGMDETYPNYSSPGPRDTMTLTTFQGHEFKGQGHRQHFSKTHFSGGGNPIDSWPSKTT